MISSFAALCLALVVQEPLRQFVPANDWQTPSQRPADTTCCDVYGVDLAAPSGFAMRWTGQELAECELVQTAGWKRVGAESETEYADSLLTWTVSPGETIQVDNLLAGSYTVRATHGLDQRAAASFKLPANGEIELVPNIAGVVPAKHELEDGIRLYVTVSTPDPTSELSATIVLVNEAGKTVSRLPVERRAEPDWSLEPGVLNTAAGGCVVHVEGRPLQGLSLGRHPPGQYTLSAERDGHAPLVHPLVLSRETPRMRIVLALEQRPGARLDGRSFRGGFSRGREIGSESWVVSFRRLSSALAIDHSIRFESLDATTEFNIVPGATCWLEPGRVELRLSSAKSETIYVGPVNVPTRPGSIDIQALERGSRILGLQVSAADGGLWWDGPLALSIERAGRFEPLLAKGLKTKGPHTETRFRGIPAGTIGCFSDFERTRFLGSFEHDGESSCVHLRAVTPGLQSPRVVRSEHGDE